MLGIFEGKKTEYNRLVLQSLLHDPKTTKQIAEYIYLNRKNAIPPPKLNENHVRRIVSIISRRTKTQKGRLEELETKQYIRRENSAWHPTIKGIAVSLTLFNSITEGLPYAKDEPANVLRDLGMKLLEIPGMNGLTNSERLTKALDFGFFQNYQQLVQGVKDCTISLIKEGVNLDKISEKEFYVLLVSKLLYYYSNLELFEKLQRILFSSEQKERSPAESKKGDSII